LNFGRANGYDTLALIGIHLDNKFYEFVPWGKGPNCVSWNVTSFGDWSFDGVSTINKISKFRTTCRITTASNDFGTAFRVPDTQGQNSGLKSFVRDSLRGRMILTLWKEQTLPAGDIERTFILQDAECTNAAVEIGGGDQSGIFKGENACWSAKSRLAQPLKFLVGL